jgi:ABC-2 type transport system permease protein
MKDKLLFLTKISIKKKVATKWFLIANIIMAILIIGLANVDTIIKSFGGDFNLENKLLVIDNGNYFEEFKTSYESSSSIMNEYTSVKITKYNGNIDNAKKEITDDNTLVLVLNKDDINYINASIYSKSGIDTIKLTVINTALNTLRSNIALKEYNITEDMLVDINKPVVIDKIVLDESNSSLDGELITGVIFPIIVLPFFFLTVFLIQMIGNEVNEEKSTKSMEIIISNVSPQVHLASKVISANVFVLMQGVLIILYGMIGVLLRILFIGSININTSQTGQLGSLINTITSSGVIDKLTSILPYALILMILTFIGYSLLSGVLASMTTNSEDYQQLQTPMVIILLSSFYLSMMSSLFKGSTFIKIMSYIPFVSSLLSPTLYALGEITLIDISIAIILMILTLYILLKYGLRIYKAGILNYSQDHLWKRMLKAVKERR